MNNEPPASLRLSDEAIKALRHDHERLAADWQLACAWDKLWPVIEAAQHCVDYFATLPKIPDVGFALEDALAKLGD